MPGSTQGTFLVVSDLQEARKTLIAQGANVSDVFHFDEEYRPVPGADSRGDSYFSYATFNDPDGNGWVLQQVKTRLPGRGLSWDLPTLTDLLREAEQHHGQYEPTAPKHHWSGWYAAYVMTCPRCALTVISLMPRGPPTCLFNSPDTTSAILAFSRGERRVARPQP